MAALTVATTATIQRESLGSLTLLMVPLVGTTTSDTWTGSPTMQVVSFWAQPNIGSTSTSVIDVTYVASTGIFTFSTVTNDGAFTLFILVRN